MTPSPNTRSALLLTAPLIFGRRESSFKPLTLSEYKKLARFLRERQSEPADLISPHANVLLNDSSQPIELGRINSLLSRGVILANVLDYWQRRGIWVISRADPQYPRLLKQRLNEDAPPVLYGCGDASLLNTGGLAVVGSRDISDETRTFTYSIGSLAARGGNTVVSGGARGADQAAMDGALASDGKSVGVLADKLDQAVLHQKNLNHLMNGQLVLVSPFDPAISFNVGCQMQRNKLIYCLSDAAVVVNSDYGRGGTWAGAIEQLNKLHFVPIFVRISGEHSKGLQALQGKGALPWSNPDTPSELANMLSLAEKSTTDAAVPEASEQLELFPKNLEHQTRPSRERS
jgi:DNA processing protein